MMLKNPFTLAIFAILGIQSAVAITIDPVQIQSAPGELLYAEIKFKNLAPQARLDVSLANPEDLRSLGISHQPPGHLNFFTRRNNQGEGVITITSNRPITQAELDILIKIQAGDSLRFQHIRKSMTRASSLMAQQQNSLKPNETPLQPLMIVSEKEIALNLPTATLYMPAPAKEPVIEKLLNARQALPPSLENAAAIAAPVADNLLDAESDPVFNTQHESTQTAALNETASINTVPETAESISLEHTSQFESSDPLAQAYAANTVSAASEITPDTPTASEPQTAVASAESPTQHVVQSNESLWKIADRIAKQQGQSIQDVMQQIKQANEHAFVKGDANRLRRGVTLNLNQNFQAQKNEQQQKQLAEIAKKIPSTQSGKAKYRLNQAEMSLVAEHESDSGNASAVENTKTNKTSKELSLKVMTAREKTVKLQRNVTQLELSLSQKNHRIQLLNARLAQLQQQLQAQQVDKKSNL